MPNKKFTIESVQRVEQILLDNLDFHHVVQRVVDGVLVELTEFNPNYRIAVLLLYNPHKRLFERISISQTDEARKTLEASSIDFKDISIPISATNNVAVRVYHKKQRMITHDFKDVLGPVLPPEEARAVQQHAGIKTSVVYPVNVKNKTIGAMIFSKITYSKNIPNDENQFLTYFTSLAGLAVQNSKLYTEIEEKTEQLASANKELRQLDKRKDEFISFASHELKTPITVTKNSLWMLRNIVKKTFSPQEEKFFEEMEDGLSRLQSIVNNLLDVSRIQQGRLILEMSDHDICEIIQKSLKSFEHMAVEKQLELKYHGPESVCIKTDAGRFREVFDNFLSNAIKYTNQGHIDIFLEDQKGEWKVSVTDTGPGISKDDYKKIFTKFGRATEGLKQKQAGTSTGLGLYITKKMVEAMGGKTGFTSEVGKGTTFWFTLPVGGKDINCESSN